VITGGVASDSLHHSQGGGHGHGQHRRHHFGRRSACGGRRLRHYKSSVVVPEKGQSPSQSSPSCSAQELKMTVFSIYSTFTFCFFVSSTEIIFTLRPS
jgi:hypothetical protein